MKYDFELIPVPTDALEAVGIIPGVMAEAFVDGKRIVIQKAENDAFCESYNEDCEECPYPIGAETGNFTLEHNAVAVDVGEDVIKGSIAIIKHTDDGSTKIETPEAGAQFQIYLKASGSYDAADPDERDVLVCGEDGFAQSKALPYTLSTARSMRGRSETAAGCGALRRCGTIPKRR